MHLLRQIELYRPPVQEDNQAHYRFIILRVHTLVLNGNVGCDVSCQSSSLAIQCNVSADVSALAYYGFLHIPGKLPPAKLEHNQSTKLIEGPSTDAQWEAWRAQRSC